MKIWKKEVSRPEVGWNNPNSPCVTEENFKKLNFGDRSEQVLERRSTFQCFWTVESSNHRPTLAVSFATCKIASFFRIVRNVCLERNIAYETRYFSVW